MHPFYIIQATHNSKNGEKGWEQKWQLSLAESTFEHYQLLTDASLLSSLPFVHLLYMVQARK